MVTHSKTNEDVFGAVADPTRRSILDALRAGPVPVNQLAAAFPMSRPAISKHLRVLRASKLVKEKRKGRFRMYQLNPAPLKNVDQWLSEYRIFWQQNLRSLKKYVEKRNG
jgi:DNA-binding transcriptional ArsR family regulator